MSPLEIIDALGLSQGQIRSAIVDERFEDAIRIAQERDAQIRSLPAEVVQSPEYQRAIRSMLMADLTLSDQIATRKAESAARVRSIGQGQNALRAYGK